MIRFLHGATGEPGDWQQLIDLLDGHEAVAVDLYAGEIEGLDETAEEINALAASGDVLVGYSMGGRLALHALLAEGTRWSKAVIISAHTGNGHDPERLEADREWARLARTDWGRFVERWSAQAVFGGQPSPWDRQPPTARREAIARGFERWSLGSQQDLLPSLHQVSIPVLWLAGGRDEKYVAIARRACSELPDARLETVPDSGHRVPWETPGRCAEAIRSFLS